MSTAPAPGHPDDRLESWKAIADYLGKSQTSVRRWEREEGMPVRRQEHLRRGSVVAFKSEIDEWRARRTSPLSEDAPQIKPGSRFRAAPIAVAASAAGILFAVASVPRTWEVVQYLPLTSYPEREVQVAFAPNGVDFAYIKNGYSLVVETPGRPPREIWIATGNWVCCTRWSPDGNWIAVSHSDADRRTEIVIVDRFGNRRPGPRIDGGPGFAWRADSASGLFPRREKERPSKIFEYHLETGATRQALEPPPNSWGDISCAESRDGNALAVVRYSEMGKGDIYVRREGDSELRRITQISTWINGLDWLPDNRTIVFASTVDKRIGLFQIDSAAPGVPLPIEHADGDFTYPSTAVRADGSVWVAAGQQWIKRQLSLVDPARGVSNVAESTRDDESPALSDSGKLAFQSNRTGASDLWTCQLPCAAARRLTSNTEPNVAMTPRWSPDESRIAFVARKAGKASIWTIGADGSDPRLLSTGHDEGSPAWSANGAEIFFRSDRSGRSEIWRIPAAGGAAVQITKSGGAEGIPSSDGAHLYYIRTNQAADLLRLDIRSGVETVVEDVPPLTLHRWTLTDNLLTFVDPGHTSPAELKQFDLTSGKTRVVVHGGLMQTVGITANRAGAVVFSNALSQHSDIISFELRRRPLWQLFSKR